MSPHTHTPPHRMSECTVHDIRAAEPVCFVGGCQMVPMVEAVKVRQQAARALHASRRTILP